MDRVWDPGFAEGCFHHGSRPVLVALAARDKNASAVTLLGSRLYEELQRLYYLSLEEGKGSEGPDRALLRFHTKFDAWQLSEPARILWTLVLVFCGIAAEQQFSFRFVFAQLARHSKELFLSGLRSAGDAALPPPPPSWLALQSTDQREKEQIY